MFIFGIFTQAGFLKFSENRCWKEKETIQESSLFPRPKHWHSLWTSWLWIPISTPTSLSYGRQTCCAVSSFFLLVVYLVLEVFKIVFIYLQQVFPFSWMSVQHESYFCPGTNYHHFIITTFPHRNSYINKHRFVEAMLDDADVRSETWLSPESMIVYNTVLLKLETQTRKWLKLETNLKILIRVGGLNRLRWFGAVGSINKKCLKPFPYVQEVEEFTEELKGCDYFHGWSSEKKSLDGMKHKTLGF